MAKKGRRVVFHGAFKTKAAAVRKEQAGRGRFVRPVQMKGRGRRYLVMSRRS